MSIRVLVAVDQSMIRAGFRMLLADEPDIAWSPIRWSHSFASLWLKPCP